MSGSDSNMAFEKVLEEAVTGGLESKLGDTAKVLSLYLDPKIAVKKPDSYVKCLLKCLPVEDKIREVVIEISRRLYENSGIEFRERSGWRLSDYVGEARTHYFRRFAGS